MLTPTNLRHCVNSISMNFVSTNELATKTGQMLCRAYFAGGCFWGVEHLMQQQPGVVDAVSGYMSGHKDEPTYREVCSHTTGHLEVVEGELSTG